MFIAVATPAALVTMFYMYRNRYEPPLWGQPCGWVGVWRFLAACWLHEEGLQRWRLANSEVVEKGERERERDFLVHR